MHEVRDLDGVNIARILADESEVSITISAASGFATSGQYYPAESIRISSITGVAELRAACEAALEAHLAATQEAPR